MRRADYWNSDYGIIISGVSAADAVHSEYRHFFPATIYVPYGIISPSRKKSLSSIPFPFSQCGETTKRKMK
jgi:hypothetical protein